MSRGVDSREIVGVLYDRNGAVVMGEGMQESVRDRPSLIHKLDDARFSHGLCDEHSRANRSQREDGDGRSHVALSTVAAIRRASHQYVRGHGVAIGPEVLVCGDGDVLRSAR